MEQNTEYRNPQPPQEDEIDLVEIIRFVWDARRTILIIIGIFIALGLFVSLLSTPQYTARARVLPEIQQAGGGGSDLLRQLAGRTGIRIGSDGYEALRPDLYPRVLSSTPFFYDMLEKEIRVSGMNEPVTIQNYVLEHMGGSLVLGAARRYTIGLPGTIKGWVSKLGGTKESPDEIAETHAGIPRLNESEFLAIEILRGRIQADMDMQDWIISVSAEMPDPVAAAHVADLAVNYLSDYVIEYQTEKAQKDLAFIRERYQEKKAEFHEAQQRLAEFQDANRNVVSAAVQTEEQRLQHQYTLAFNLYNELAQRLEDAQIRVQEETPVVKTLEPVQVPMERSKPKRTQLMMIYTFLGVVLGVGFVFGRREYYKLRGKLRE